ncbi:MAG: glucose transporter [Treponema sp. CETP13]|nr:MAG: glucose transporter [Treponema sp. CETP13]
MANIYSKHKEKIYSILLIIPSVILVGIFVYGFIGNTIYDSLTDWTGFEVIKKHFIGVANYKDLFTSSFQSMFRQDLVNAIFYMVFMLVSTLLVGLLLAILLDRKSKVKGERFFTTVFLYPMALSFIVSGTIWRWLLAPNGGVNLIPTWVGLNKSKFLWISSRQQIWSFNWQNIFQIIFVIALIIFAIFLINAITKKNKKAIKKYAITCSIIAVLVFVIFKFLPPAVPRKEIHGFNLATLGIIWTGCWQYAGYTMALYLAGLRGLSESTRESAKLDGANEFIYYTKIALPNMRPITMSATVLISHIALKMFDLIYAMAGTDNGNTGHPSINMYTTTFRANNFALGSAMAVILFILAASFIIPYMVNQHHQRVNA